MPVSTKGRVEQQKRNQTDTFKWSAGFVFGVQLNLMTVTLMGAIRNNSASYIIYTRLQIVMKPIQKYTQ